MAGDHSLVGDVSMIVQQRLAPESGRARKHTLNVLLNVGGIAFPVLAALLTVPPLVERLGHEGFATLALGWTIVGYFSLLDLGLGRALTLHIARHAGQQEPVSLAALARTVRGLMLGFGLLWTFIPLALFPFLGDRWPVLWAQTASPAMAWTFLVLCIPLTLWLNSSASILEAESRFVEVNAVRIPLGIATYAAPWSASLLTTDISWLFGSLLLTRGLGATALAWRVRGRFAAGSVQPGAMRNLLKFGGWMTVSQIVGPVLVYFDRFAIAAVVSAAAVTHYTVPFDILTRLPLFPIAIMSVLFPIFVQAHDSTRHGVASGARPAASTFHLLVVAWLPAMLLAAFFGPELLRLWVGDPLASASATIWQWLIVGVAVNGLAHLPLTLLQSRGRADIVAGLHLLELIPYTAAVWWALQHHGVVGAAVVWSVRVTVDAILLHVCATMVAPQWRTLIRISAGASIIAAGVLAALAWSRG